MYTLHVADPLFDLIRGQNFCASPPRIVTDNAAIHSTTSDNSFKRMIQDLHKINSDEFDAYELEECGTWVATTRESCRCAKKIEKFWSADLSKPESASSLRPLPPPPLLSLLPSCHAVYILATFSDSDKNNCNNNNNNIPAGGIVVEIYPEARVSMLSYVVTCPSFRGKGLGKILVQYAAYHMSELCAAFTGQPLSALLVDVAQHRDAESEEGKQVAISRQTIWSKLGFSPVEGYDMVYPGYLGTARYCVGVFRQKFSSAPAADKNGEGQQKHQELNNNKTTVDKAALVKFLEIMFTSVWYDEAELQREERRRNNKVQQHSKSPESESSSSEEDSSSEDEEEEDEDEEEKQEVDEADETNSKYRLLNPSVLSKCITENLAQLHAEFENYPDVIPCDDKFWK